MKHFKKFIASALVLTLVFVTFAESGHSLQAARNSSANVTIAEFAADVRERLELDDIPLYAEGERPISGAQAAYVLAALLDFDPALVPTQARVSVPEHLFPYANLLLDLQMVPQSLLERESLTQADADVFIDALETALAIGEGPYRLRQERYQDNFFIHHNRAVIAGARPGAVWEAMANSEDNVQLLLAEIMDAEPEPGSDAWRIWEFVNQYMAPGAAELALERIRPVIEDIRAASTIEEFNAVADEQFIHFQLQPFYQIEMTQDLMGRDAADWALYFEVSHPELSAEQLSAPEVAAAKRLYFANVLEFLGETEDLEARAQDMFDFYYGLAQIERVVSPYERDASVMYVQAGWDEMLDVSANTGALARAADMFDLHGASVYAPEPEFVRFAEGLYVQENLRAARDFAKHAVLLQVQEATPLRYPYLRLRAELDAALGEEPAETEPALQAAKDLAYATLTVPFNNLFAERFADEGLKDSAEELFEEVRAGVRAMLAENGWMSDYTRELSLEKLDAITPLIAYPRYGEILFDKTPEITALEDGGNLVDVFLSGAERTHEFRLFNRTLPATGICLWTEAGDIADGSGARYMPVFNAISIPLGILTEPMFGANNTREENLARMGYIIGHEIIHAFDDQGGRFDLRGNFREWWAEEDLVLFEEMVAKLTGKILAFEYAVPITHRYATTETIADTGGLAVVLAIAREEGLDLRQFFEAYADIWGQRLTSSSTAVRLQVIGYPPPLLRGNFVLSQFDEFHDTFGIRPGDGMYTPRGERIRIF